ncbi:MAG TPA: ATP-dependent Clp protease proteolytic subunit [Bacteroidia bacterium]|nr:ATP-dependent Clp protease proteolytic subunit [Bacteroidia bacterium]HNS11898.1 ATP-dependent Clp protease proteolytic subunit [Bacteroidia bacterium]
MEKAIRFLAQVNPQTSDQLFQAIDNLLRQGTTKIRLLLSTPGGSVFHGLSIHNYLKGLPIEVHTYNFGSVDSIGVVIFSAGSRRFTVPHSRFLIHSVKFNINGQASLDEKQLEEYLKSLQIDQKNIAKVIADTTGKSVEAIDNAMNNRTTLSPQEAVEYGLVHEIKNDLLLPKMEVITIGEPIQGQPYQQTQFVVPTTQAVSKPSIDSFTNES